MESSPSFFIHIGAPKTGTTFLQRTLTENRSQLLSQGLLYPASCLRGYGHHDIAFLLNGSYPEWAVPQAKTLGELSELLSCEVAAHDGSVLMSSEDFYLFSKPDRLCRLLAESGILGNRRPVIIAYVRRQDDAHESWYNQTIKAQGYTHSARDCVETYFHLWDYAEQLAKWASVFGDENLVVRAYETSQFAGRDLLTDLSLVLGIERDQLSVSPERTNPSLNRDLLEFQRILNSLPVPPVEKRSFHRHLMELSEATKGGGLFDESSILDQRFREEIMNRYAEGNRKVGERFLGGKCLFQEDNLSTCIASSSSTSLSTEKLAHIMAWILLKMSKSAG